ISNIPVLNLKNYRVLILEILDVEVTDNIYDKIKISKEFVSKYFEEEVIYEIVDIDYKSIAIILEDKLSEEELEEVMICLANHCERNFKLTFSIAITKEYAKLNEMPRAYKEAKKILDYKFVFKQKRVIFLKDLDETQTKKYYYPIEIEAKLITKTLNANEIGIKRILDEIFDESNTADIDKKHLKEFSGLLYNSLGRILIQLKEMNPDIDPKIFSSEEILRANDLKELREKFEEKILDVCKITKERDEDDNSDIKNKIEKYLEDNYHIDISLDNLADYLGHSFKYTSILFKKVMGDNFKNYLNIYRIEKAKEIMAENKDIKIKDLAERIGYNSSNTFIRIFRKYEGVSPGKYFGLNE
ncbi:MAG: helix-turn-helix domain-containing protein, partial [Fusobacterium mortiferum]